MREWQAGLATESREGGLRGLRAAGQPAGLDSGAMVHRQARASKSLHRALPRIPSTQRVLCALGGPESYTSPCNRAAPTAECKE